MSVRVTVGFVEFIEESFGVVKYLGLSKIPHYTTLQKAAARLTHGILLKMLESFVMYVRIRKIFAGIDSTGLSHGQASYYYTKRLKLRRKFVKIPPDTEQGDNVSHHCIQLLQN